MRRLEPRDLEILFERYLGGLTVKAIAKKRAMSPTPVGKKLNQMRVELQETTR